MKKTLNTNIVFVFYALFAFLFISGVIFTASNGLFNTKTAFAADSEIFPPPPPGPPVPCVAPKTIVCGVCKIAATSCTSPNVLSCGVCYPPAPPCLAPNSIINGVCTPPPTVATPGHYFDDASFVITSDGGSSNVSLGNHIVTELTLTTKNIGFVHHPSDIVLVMDRTASMNDAGKMSAAKLALGRVVDTVANSGIPNIRIAFVSYNTGAVLHQDFTTNYNAVKIAINGMTPSGYTSIGAGLFTAGQAFVNNPSPNPNTKKFIILASDGYQNTKPAIALGLTAIPMDVMIYTIGIGNSSNLDDRAMTSIAENGGSKNGLYFPASTAYLSGVFNSIMNQILGYFLLDNISIELRRDDTTHTSFDPASDPLSSGVTYDAVNGIIKWGNLGSLSNSRSKAVSLSFMTELIGTGILLNKSTLKVSYMIEGVPWTETVPVNILSMLIFNNPSGICHDTAWDWKDPVLIKCDVLPYPEVSNCGSIRMTQGDVHCTQCSDYVDNDHDGRIDYPIDLGCRSWADNSELNSLTYTEF